MPNITKRLVDATKPEKSRQYIWDNKIPGFGLVVQPNGTKSFCYQYRNAHGANRRMGLGKYGGSNTPEEARQKAMRAQRDVGQGIDPMGEKKARRDALTVSELLDIYVRSAKFAEKAELTRKYDQGRITRHLNPLLGKKVADQLTRDDLRKALADIEAGKTAGNIKTGPRGLARVKGGPGAARMAIRMLKSAYSWAAEQGLIASNPTAGFKVSQDNRREAVLTADDYKTLFETIDQMETFHQVRRPVADAIRVIALTGARRGEIAGLCWRHVDLKKGVAVLPRGEHKAGKKTGEPRVIGLPAVAQAIITRQAEGKPEDYVFRPARGAGPLSLSKPWRAIRSKAGLSDDIGLHSLRHSLATQMAVSGAQAAQIMAVMGHRDLSTSQKYIHIAQDARTEMAEQAAAGISSALTGSKAAEVVKINE